MKSLYARIQGAIEGLRPPYRQVALGTLWLCASAVAALLARNPLFAVPWFLWNAGLATISLGWAVFHPRELLPGVWSAARWALGMTVLTVLVGSSAVETSLAEQFGTKVSYSMMLLGRVIFFVPIFAMLGFLGILTASVAVFATRRTSPKGAARLGTGIGWLYALALLVGTGLFSAREDLGAVLFSGLPTLVFVTCRRCGAGDAWTPLRELARRFAQRCVLRAPIWGAERTLDLRGLMVGGIAGLLAVLVGGSGVLIPVQGAALVTLIRVWTEPATEFIPSFAQFSVSTKSEVYRRFVLLEFDPETERRMLTEGSEAETQAEIIRRLKQYGAEIVMLPEPVADQQPAVIPSLTAPVPQATREAIGRTKRDTPKLVAAVSEAGNVVLGAIPVRRRLAALAMSGGIPTETPPGSEVLRAVRPAARTWGWLSLTSFGTLQLPAIPTSDTRSLPLVIASLATGKRLDLHELPGGQSVLVGERKVPTVPGNRILVSFTAPGPGKQFRRVPYSTVFRGEPVYDEDSPFRTAPKTITIDASGTGQSPVVRAGAGKTVTIDPFDPPKPAWRNPSDFFRGKIVFLDSLSHDMQATPIGEMPVGEAAATATAMLLSGKFVRAVPIGASILAVLLLAMLTGVLCSRLNPLEGGWRALAIGALAVLATLGLFLIEQVWFDPVVPVAAVLAAYLAATQVTFNQEREQRQFWSRFVAPQLVERFIGSGLQPHLGGRRERICVLFADVRGFTRFAEQTDPEEVLRITNAYLGAMRTALFNHDGILDKYTGDGLMAFFMIRGDGEEGVERAVRAAVEMRDAAQRVSLELAAQGVPPLGVGIGLHYGEAVVGLVGHENHPSLTAVGHTVVVSQRLQTLAAGGQVIVSEGVSSFRSVQAAFSLQPRDPVQVKGITGPVLSFEVCPKMALAAPAVGSG